MTKESWMLFGAQVVAHLSIIPAIIYFSPWYFALTLFVYFLTGCFGMTMTYHRLLSHKSWEAPEWFRKLGTLLGAYGLVGSSIGWVSMHREHHAYTDTEKDPHSPHFGVFKAHFLSMFSNPSLRFGVDLVRDPFHVKVHKYYFHAHALIFLALACLSPMLLVFGYLLPAMILWNAGSLINTLNHMQGYRNTDTKDSSTNNLFSGYFVWGEGWHNNHHANPRSWSFSSKWWEFDWGGFFIKRIRNVKTTETT